MGVYNEDVLAGIAFGAEHVKGSDTDSEEDAILAPRDSPDDLSSDPPPPVGIPPPAVHFAEQQEIYQPGPYGDMPVLEDPNKKEDGSRAKTFATVFVGLFLFTWAGLRSPA